jgi:hypothetical protein
MRIRELVEGKTGSIQDDVAAALPATYTIPKLRNQDPYKQYRFGVAIAQAKGQSEQTEKFEPTTAWGENLVVVSYEPGVDKFIDDALKLVGLSSSDKKLISTLKSEEAKGTGTLSPVANWMGKEKNND